MPRTWQRGSRRTGARRILEMAAGTGVVTAGCWPPCRTAEIVATDLNPAMLESRRRGSIRPVSAFRRQTPRPCLSPTARFDAVVCQFGVMFFPDRVGAYREARRVLKPGGAFLFNAWGRVEENRPDRGAGRGGRGDLPRRPAGFLPPRALRLSRHRPDRGGSASGRLHGIEIETVEKRSRIGSAREAAIGLCQGSPLRAEIEARGEPRGGDRRRRARRWRDSPGRTGSTRRCLRMWCGRRPRSTRTRSKPSFQRKLESHFSWCEEERDSSFRWNDVFRLGRDGHALAALHQRLDAGAVHFRCRSRKSSKVSRTPPVLGTVATSSSIRAMLLVGADEGAHVEVHRALAGRRAGGRWSWSRSCRPRPARPSQATASSSTPSRYQIHFSIASSSVSAAMTMKRA